VAVAAAAQLNLRCLLVGDARVIRAAADRVGVEAARLVVVGRDGIAALEPPRIGIWKESRALEGAHRPGRPDAAAGAAQLAWIDQATDLVREGASEALVTGPVSKAMIAASGASGFLGHTEHLAARLGAEEVVMAFATERFSTALVTTHLPLRRVPDAIDARAVAVSSYWLARLLADRGIAEPRIVVGALNPHAGESGLIGDEEERVLAPGIDRARQRLAAEGRACALEGPQGADTAYRRAAAGEVDGVVAMYHDQATIACKLVGFGEAVNVTLGLPILRTSVDHGTAYDLAGSGRASASGMCAALRLAAKLARAKR
jgi:4-hydroxythreonine-4-phosphate dehydrogenase